MKLGEIAAASTQTIKVPFVPEYIIMKAATLATGVTSLKVNVFGEGTIVDLPNAGVAALDAMGQVSDDSTTYVIPLANGKFVNKDCEITIENTQAAAITEVHGFGTRIGTHFIKSVAESYLIYNSADINKFLFLAHPAANVGDQITAVYNVMDEMGNIVSTFNEQLSIVDVKAMGGAYQFNNGYIFNNMHQLIKSISIKMAANATIYYSRIVESAANH